MRGDTRIYVGGFNNPVMDAQGVFRSLMNGFARPGTVHAVPAPVEAPTPLSNVAGAIALTLCDHDTPIWLAPELQVGDIVPRWLSFHTGCPVTHDKTEATFAFFADTAPLAALGCFAAGTEEYPDRSTTLVLPVPGFSGGEELRLEGPGIDGHRLLAPILPPVFPAMWSENRSRFPRGADLVLTCGDSFLCLPRTTRISAMERA